MLFFTVPNNNGIEADDTPFTLGNFSPKDKPPVRAVHARPLGRSRR